MRIEFPTKFKVDYPIENKKYYNEPNKNTISKILLLASKGFCMYCGKRMEIDGNTVYNLEHSLEKSIDKKKYYILRHCKFNISVACPTCNQKYKTRMIESVESKAVDIQELLNISEQDCLVKECQEPCEKYIKLKEIYLQSNSILLQPSGLSGCGIEYDLLKQVFKPKVDDEESKDIVQEHINRFHLNKEMFSRCVVHICEFAVVVYENAGKELSFEGLFNILNNYPVENRIGLEFITFLKENFNRIEDVVEFCKFFLVLEYL